MKELMRKFWKNNLEDKTCLFLIIGLFVVFSLPFWLKGKIPFSSTYLVNNFPPWQYYYGLPVKNAAMPDVNSQIFPWRYLSIEAFRLRQFPLWNPYNFSGTPLLANYQSAPFHPGNIFFLFLPLIKAWSVLVLLPAILAPLLTFLYLREINLSSQSAVIASLGFGFCGFLVCWLAYGTMSWAILWLPLALWAIEKFLKGFWWAGPLLSLAISFSLFSGHFQTSLYFLLAVGCYLVFSAKRRLGRLLLFFFLGIFLASPQLWSTWEFYQQAVRKEFLRVSEAIPWRYLITLIAPDFYGNPVTRNDWFGHYAEWSGYVGVIPLILALYGLLLEKKDFHFKFFAFLALMALLVAVYSPLQEKIVNWEIPVLSTSAFSRIIVLYSFAMAVMAAFGLEQLRENWQKKRVKKTLLFLFLVGLVFLAVWGWLLFARSEKALIAKRNFILSTLLFGAAGVCFLAGLFRKNWRPFLILIIFFLTAFDSLRFARKWLPFDPQEYFYPELEVIKFLKEKTDGKARVFGNFGGELNVFRWPGIEGYDPLYIRRYGELIRAAKRGKIEPVERSTVYLDKNGEFTFRILDLLGVKFLLHAKGDNHYSWALPFWHYPENFEKIWEDEKYEVHLNKKSLPRAFLVYDYQIAESDQEIIDFIFAEETNLSQTVVLEAEPILSLTACKEKGRVDIENYSFNRIELKVDSPCPGLLFLSDNFYPGWQALIDSQPTKIYRANYSFRAIAVPEGEHQVKFFYWPESFQRGLKMALLSLAVLVIFSFWLRRRK